MLNVRVADATGKQITVSEKAFNLIYQHKGFTRVAAGEEEAEAAEEVSNAKPSEPADSDSDDGDQDKTPPPPAAAAAPLPKPKAKVKPKAKAKAKTGSAR